MKKKLYLQPFVQVDEYSPMTIVCASIGNGGDSGEGDYEAA